MPARFRLRIESSSPCGPWSNPWLFARFATSTPALRASSSAAGSQRNTNVLDCGATTSVEGHSWLMTVTSSCSNRPCRPLHAQPYPLDRNAGMYSGSRLTSPVPWISSLPFGSGLGLGLAPDVFGAALMRALAAVGEPALPSSARSTRYAAMPTPTPSAISRSPNGIRERRACRDVTDASLSRFGNQVSGSAHVPGDRLRERLGVLERLLVPQVRPELDRDRLADDVAGEIQQVGLDVQRLHAERRVGSDADRRHVLLAPDPLAAGVVAA